MVKKYTVIDRIDAIVKWIILIIVGVFTAFPFLWMVVSAFKTKEEIMDTSKFLPQSLHWENFITVIFNSPIPRYIVNSLLISLAIVFMKFKGRGILFGIIMVTYMLPTAATYIPSYIILANHQLLNTYTGLIISSSVSIFGIFLLRQAFMQVPSAMVEAAQIDGASHFRILHLVVFPMTKSSFITFGLMSFIASYNNYMWPSLITNDSDKYMVSQGLRSFFIEGGAYGTEWSLVMAASAVIVIPLLIMFAFAQKWFIDGIGGDTGVKG